MGICIADSAAVIDSGNRLLVWLGRELPAAMPDPSGDGRWTRSTLVCERFAAKLAAGRFPVPELVSVAEVSCLHVECKSSERAEE